MLGWTFPNSGILSHIVYHINLLEEYSHIQPIFYASYLCPHVGPLPTCTPPPLPLNDDDAGEFELENILDFHLNYYRTIYIINWLGYPVFEATWETAEYLANAPDIFY